MSEITNILKAIPDEMVRLVVGIRMLKAVDTELLCKTIKNIDLQGPQDCPDKYKASAASLTLFEGYVRALKKFQAEVKQVEEIYGKAL